MQILSIPMNYKIFLEINKELFFSDLTERRTGETWRQRVRQRPQEVSRALWVKRRRPSLSMNQRPK